MGVIGRGDRLKVLAPELDDCKSLESPARQRARHFYAQKDLLNPRERLDLLQRGPCQSQ